MVKNEIKKQISKGKRQKVSTTFQEFRKGLLSETYFCLLVFAFCLLIYADLSGKRGTATATTRRVRVIERKA
jgi:hypothetical protein